jgi:dihydrofolate reductase
MGRRTAESLGRALPGRRNLVLTRSGRVPFEGMQAVASLDEALQVASGDQAGELCVIGGGEVFAMTLPIATCMHLTWVDTVVDGADAFFPRFDPAQWEVVAREAHAADAKHAHEVEQRLRGDGFRKLLKNMYGDRPVWSPKLAGSDRDRAIINVFTRMRYCTPSGRIAFDVKGAPGTQPPGLYPWYSVPGRVERDLKIVCGHWSTLGLFIGHGVHAIDTGAVWGGKLTALQLDTDELRIVQVAGRDVPAPAPRPHHARS